VIFVTENETGQWPSTSRSRKLRPWQLLDGSSEPPHLPGRLICQNNTKFVSHWRYESYR